MWQDIKGDFRFVSGAFNSWSQCCKFKPGFGYRGYLKIKPKKKKEKKQRNTNALKHMKGGSTSLIIK